MTSPPSAIPIMRPNIALTRQRRSSTSASYVGKTVIPGTPGGRHALAGTILLASAVTVSAATLAWDPQLTGDPTSGGSGVWNTTSNTWYDSAASAPAIWNNGTPDSAIFGAPAGTV